MGRNQIRTEDILHASTMQPFYSGLPCRQRLISTLEAGNDGVVGNTSPIVASTLQ